VSFQIEALSPEPVKVLTKKVAASPAIECGTPGWMVLADGLPVSFHLRPVQIQPPVQLP
jgi:hypothetical protein